MDRGSRSVFLGVSLLALAACAAPAPSPSSALTPAQMELKRRLFAEHLRMDRRLFLVSERLRTAAEPLCEKKEMTIGLRAASPSQFALPDVAITTLGLRDGQRVIFMVAENSPASRAGLRAGDAIVAIDDATNQMTVERGGERITATVNSVPECAVSVALVDSSLSIADRGEPNAWGGNAGITVNTAMMWATVDDAQLGFIVGHELSHIIRGDDRPSQRESSITKTASILPFGELIARSAIAPAARERELAADDLGLRLDALAGYNVRSALHVIESLSRGGGWLADHPDTDARVAALKAVADDIERRKAAGEPVIP